MNSLDAETSKGLFNTLWRSQRAVKYTGKAIMLGAGVNGANLFLSLGAVNQAQDGIAAIKTTNSGDVSVQPFIEHTKNEIDYLNGDIRSDAFQVPVDIGLIYLARRRQRNMAEEAVIYPSQTG